MIYLLFVAIAALSTIAIFSFAARMGTVDPGAKVKLYKKTDNDIVPLLGTKLILSIIICFIIAAVLQISLYKNAGTVSFVKLYTLFVIVASAAIVDYKRRIIPNELIIFGLAFRIFVYAYEIFSKSDIKSILINDMIGLAVGFGILAVVSSITRGSVGFGDAKLFGIIGILGGSFCTYSTLLVSLVISTVVSLVGLARKKIGRKDSIPFGPCIAAGYIITLLLTSY